MTDPPTDPALIETKMRAARATLRAAVAETTATAAGRLPRGVERIARDEAKRVSRRWGLIAVAFAMLLSLGVSVAAYATASTAAALSASTKETVDAALVKLDDANRLLTARGQEPVLAPADATPAEAIQSAVLAQVLASLPPSPTAEDVANRIQAAVVAQILGPTQSQLTSQIAGYFAANPPQPGPPPTAEQIRAAVDASLAANPPPAGKDGTDGKDGRDGQPGKDGKDGPDGISVTDQQFVRIDALTCVSRVTFSNGATKDSPAGDAACPALSNGAATPSAFLQLLGPLTEAVWRSL